MASGGAGWNNAVSNHESSLIGTNPLLGLLDARESLQAVGAPNDNSVGEGLLDAYRIKLDCYSALRLADCETGRDCLASGLVALMSGRRDAPDTAN